MDGVDGKGRRGSSVVSYALRRISYLRFKFPAALFKSSNPLLEPHMLHSQKEQAGQEDGGHEYDEEDHAGSFHSDMREGRRHETACLSRVRLPAKPLAGVGACQVLGRSVGAPDGR